MTFPEFFEWAVFVPAAFGAALVALALMAVFDIRGRANRRSILMQGDDTTVFLFDDDGLIDATPEARQFLSAAPKGDNDWRRLLSLLSPRFPGA